MNFTVKELAALSGGELVGDSTLKITGAASLGRSDSGRNQFLCESKIRRAAAQDPGIGGFCSAGFCRTDQCRADSCFKSDQGVRAGRAQIRTEADHFCAWYSSQRGRRSKRSARRPCFHSTAGGDRSRSKNRRRHDHWRGELRRTRDGHRVRVSHLSARDDSRAKPHRLTRNYSQRRW